MLIRIIFLSLFLLSSSGTYFAQEIFTPVDLFFKKHPEMKKVYIDLQPTSYRSLLNSEDCYPRSCLSFIERLLDEFYDIEEVNDYLIETKKLMTKTREESLENVRELKKKLTKDDYFYEFTYKDPNKEEIGFLILNNGEITMREVISSTIYED